MTNLSSFIKFSQPEVSVSYVKGSNKQIDTVQLGVKNLSPTLDIQVNFLSDFGVEFYPPVVDIPHNGETTVQIRFNTPKLERNITDGLNTVRCVVKLASTTPLTSIPSTPSPTTNNRWFNVTIQRWVDTLPVAAIVCPPGGTAFYESDDPKGAACISNYTAQPTNPLIKPKKELA